MKMRRAAKQKPKPLTLPPKSEPKPFKGYRGVYRVAGKNGKKV